MSCKVNIFFVGAKLQDFFFITKQKAIIGTIMQTQAKFVFALLKSMLNVFPFDPKHPLIPKVGPSSNISKLSLQLSE